LVMGLGVGVAFALTFLLCRALMALFRDMPVPASGPSLDLTPATGRFTERHGRGVLATAGRLRLAAVLGAAQLQVANSSSSHVDADSEIHQGMVAIDTRMGGTTPLDVIVTMTRPGSDAAQGFGEASDAAWEDEWEDEWDNEAASESEWFTSDKM